MEALKQIGCMSGAGMDTQYSCWNGNRISFVNKGHLECYQDGLAKMKKKEKVGIKKKLKLLKGLSKDLSTFSGMGSAVNQDQNLLSEVRGKLITEAAEVLMKQLEQLKAEEKELKRKRKEAKAKTKLMLKEVEKPSASESRDCGCEEEIIQVNRLITEAEPVLVPLLREENKENGVLEDRRLQSCTKDGGGVTRRVEVCMGNKCKKSGSGALLEEFQRVMGAEGDVVGCKCMGKCRDGPNVRLFNSADHYQPTANPLHIGVALEDVGAIVGNFFSPHSKDLRGLSLNPAS